MSGLARRGLWTVGARLVSAGVGFGLTPYVVGVLGPERFGLWSLVAVAVNYAGFLDLGVSFAYVRELGRHLGAGRPDRARAALSSGTLFYLAFLGVVVPAAWVAAPVLLPLLGVGPADLPLALRVFRGVALVLAVRQATAGWRGLLLAAERHEAAARVVMVSALLHGGLTVWVLRTGWGLDGLVAEALIQAGFCAAAYGALCRKHVPSVRLVPQWVRLSDLKPLVSYGLRLQGTALADLVNGQVDKLLLGAFVGLAAVGHYEVGAKIPLQAAWLPWFLAMPAVAAAARHAGRAAGVLEEAWRLTVPLGLPLGLLLLLEPGTLLTLWMGPGAWDPASAAVLSALAAFPLASALTSPVRAVLRGSEVPRLELRAGLLAAGANALGSVLLVPRFGLPGALSATVTAAVAAQAGFLWAGLRRVYGPRIPWTTLGGPVARAVLAAAAVWTVGSVLPAPGGRGAAALRLAFAAALLFAPSVLERVLIGSRVRAPEAVR
ncbi:oligosaccharide flippase family protein [Deferrisoma sp.]